MQLTTIECDATDADGRPCGEIAAVHEVHYKYAPTIQRRPFTLDRVLVEIRYDIDCPRCGYRTQLEPVEQSVSVESQIARRKE
jgi:hypothetical protein